MLKFSFNFKRSSKRTWVAFCIYRRRGHLQVAGNNFYDMKIAFRIAILIAVNLSGHFLLAQYAVFDQEPFSQNWSQVNTPHIRVIYPEGNDSLAIGLIKRLEFQYYTVSGSLNAYPRKLSLVLRSKTTVPNGFVTLAPRRSEFFTMPPQDYNFNGTNSWLDLLAVHEFRHVVQFRKANIGFNRFISTLFGEEALAAMSFIAVPQWFWEGDAVVTETALTRSGRGRIPEFNLIFRTNLLHKGPFSYNKQYLRSFKDFVPDHYVTGYFMVSHLRRKNKSNPWDEIVEQAFSKPYIPFTFSRAIKKETGKNVVGIYKDMVEEMESLWESEMQSKEITKTNFLTNSKRKTFTNYLYPQVLPNSDVLAFKEGLGDVLQLVRIKPNGDEEREVITGLLANSGMLSAENGLVSWVEYKPDLRWGARTTNEIKVYHLKTKKIRTVTKKARYSAAALSPDGSRIASILSTEDNKFFLTIIDSKSGNEIYRFLNPGNKFLSMPRWLDDGSGIIALQTSDEGKTIISASLENNSIQELFPPTNSNYGHPIQTGQFVLYNLARNGIDNIYAYDTESKRHFQVTSSRFGAFNPSINPSRDTLYYNDYQVNGMDIVKIPMRSEEWLPIRIERTDSSGENFLKPIINQERELKTKEPSIESNFTIDSYNPVKNIFNIHSWGVLLTESDNFIAMGIKSRDVLGTTAFSVGYAHNPFENSGHAYSRISYQGFYPIIDIEAKVGNRRIEESFKNDEALQEHQIKWNEKHLSLGLRLPLNFTRSKYFKSLQIGSKYQFTNVDDYDFHLRKIDQQANGALHAFEYDIQFYRLLKTSKRDINSRWGQYFDISYTHTPLKGDYEGQIFHAQTILYNPGMFKHHSFFLKGSYQHQNIDGNYRFGSSMIYPRGYSYVSTENLYVASANYSLPIFYPDWSVGPFFYFQRLKGNAFYDLGWGTNPGLNQPIRFESIGMELSVDFNFMRFLPLFNVGFRYLYLPQVDSFESQIIIGTLGF